MGERRRDILARLPIVFGLSADEAGAAIGVSVGTFREMVADKRMPRPRKIGSRLVWDVDELRAAFKSLPRDGECDDIWSSVSAGTLLHDARTPVGNSTHNNGGTSVLQEFYDKLGYDPQTMTNDDLRRLMAEARQKWRESIPRSSFNKRELNALLQLRQLKPNEPIRFQDLKGVGPDTADRLEARGYLLQSFHPDEPTQLMHYVLTEAGLAAANALALE